MVANNDDRLGFGRETQHAFVSHLRARLSRRELYGGTVPRLHKGEASTSRSRLSHGSSSQGHVSPDHVDQD